MRWQGPDALSEDFRLWLATELPFHDFNLRLYTFSYDPATETLHWRHQGRPLVDTSDGEREVIADGLTKGSLKKILATYQAECLRLTA